MAGQRSQSIFSLTDPVFLAGKSGAASALALLLVAAFSVPDKVTASFVAVLCCAPAALLGLRTSIAQMVGSAIGGSLGALAAYLALPEPIGVPLAISLAILFTHAIGFHQGTVVAAFTALFVQIVSFGGPVHTFAYRIEAVALAALSAFIVNVLVSAFFYESLFRKRLRRARSHLDTLIARASSEGPAVLHSFFGVTTQLDVELAQSVRELSWRGNTTSATKLRSLQGQAIWLRDYAHLLVDLEFGLEEQRTAIAAFFAWLAEREGPAPAISGRADATRTRILEHLAANPVGDGSAEQAAL